MTFFWRILLSIWAIVLITVFVTFWVTFWLPQHKDDGRNTRFPEQMTELVANELRDLLTIDPANAANTLANERILDFSPLLSIYVIDPGGNDVLARPLPETVDEAIEPAGRTDWASAVDTQHIHVVSEELQGYVVVGVEGYFLLRDVIMKPGGRGLLILFSIAASVLVSVILARFIVLPVRRLQLAEQTVAAGDLSVRVAHTVGGRSDEIARLAHDFDLMTERVESLLKSQQRILRDVSHELRSPLARLQALMSIARQTATKDSADQIDRMENELERLDVLIGEILSFARLESQTGIARHSTDIVDLVQNIVDDASLEGQADGKEIRLQAPAACVVQADSSLIHSAIENVVRNALKFTAPGSVVDVEVSENEDTVRIAVDDDGPGVPEEATSMIFEPFYRVGDSRSRRTGSGGIGLAIAQRSIRLHGGTIAASNRDSGGLRVEMTLPTSA